MKHPKSKKELTLGCGFERTISTETRWNANHCTIQDKRHLLVITHHVKDNCGVSAYEGVRLSAIQEEGSQKLRANLVRFPHGVNRAKNCSAQAHRPRHCSSTAKIYVNKAKAKKETDSWTRIRTRDLHRD